MIWIKTVCKDFQQTIRSGSKLYAKIFSRRHNFVGSDLDPNCLQRFLADNKILLGLIWIQTVCKDFQQTTRLNWVWSGSKLFSKIISRWHVATNCDFMGLIIFNLVNSFSIMSGQFPVIGSWNSEQSVLLNFLGHNTLTPPAMHLKLATLWSTV